MFGRIQVLECGGSVHDRTILLSLHPPFDYIVYRQREAIVYVTDISAP
jgi:hypothetical protein